MASKNNKQPKKIKIIHNRTKKKNNKKQSGGLGLTGPAGAFQLASAVGSAVGMNPLEIAGLYMRATRLWVKIQIALMKNPNNPKAACPVIETAIRDLIQILKHKNMKAFSILTKPLQEIQPIIKKCDPNKLIDEIKKKIVPLTVRLVKTMMENSPTVIKMIGTALKSGSDGLKGLIDKAEAIGISVGIDKADIEEIIKSDIAKEIIKQSSSPKTPGSRVAALYEQDAEDSDTEETDAEETDSGKPASNNIVASMYKDNPQAGVDRANDKVQKWENILSSADGDQITINEAKRKIEKYNSLSQQYGDMNKKGGNRCGTRKNMKKLSKKKTIKYKCL